VAHVDPDEDEKPEVLTEQWVVEVDAARSGSKLDSFVEVLDASARFVAEATGKPGSVILDHDGGGDRSQTLAAIPSIIETLKARGYSFVTVTDLLGLRLSRTSP